MKSITLSLLTLAFCIPCFAQLSTSRLFNDHMVLQRNQQIPVWGWAKANAKIKIALSGQQETIKAGKNGYWKALLKPMTEGGPYRMTISSGKEQLTYNDIMVGEVWICSGQSNMEFQLKNALGYRAEQKNALAMPIRQFMVPKKMSLEPENTLSDGRWLKADTNTVGDFTAVGYFFLQKGWLNNCM
jgi:sialate O-acetylesterase